VNISLLFSHYTFKVNIEIDNESVVGVDRDAILHFRKCSTLDRAIRYLTSFKYKGKSIEVAECYFHPKLSQSR
jgi:hypothetical protein